MTTSNRSWDIGDSSSAAAAVLRTPATKPQPRAKGLNQASASIVLVLMIVTSVLAIVDLYLLTTALPH
ncbi:MAG: hypothetical protein ABSH30_13115 [Acidimicrobiales bacterium]|jgi:hypothetical protein